MDSEHYLKTLETLDQVSVYDPQTGRQILARVAQPLSSQALARIVERELILQTAKDENKLPSPDDVNKELELQQKINPNLVDSAKAIGLTLDDVKDMLRLELARYNLVVGNNPQKTLKDAKDYVAKNPKMFETPPTVTLRWIVLESGDKKTAVDKDLAAGVTFGAVAAKYSAISSAKTDNGAFNPQPGSPVPRPVPLTAQSLPKELYDAAQKTSPGKVSDWIKVQAGGWVKILVENKTAVQKNEPSAAQLELVRRQLTQQERMGEIDVNGMLMKKLLASDIQVIPGYLKKNWETVFTQLKQRQAQLGEKAAEPPKETPKAETGTDKG